MPRERDLDDSDDDSSDERRDHSRNSSAGSAMGDIPMSMLSYATVGNGDGGDDDDDDVDIEQFREDCWRRISTAYAQGGGIAELAEDLEGDDEGAEADKNTIKVSVRTRPINDREIRLGTRGCIEHLSDGRNIIVRKYNWKEEPYDMNFAFDFAFDESSTQDQVFTKLGWKALKYAFSGYNASIFAYGQTGSGKSHSMIGTENDPGLIRRIGDFLFDFIQRGEDELGLKYKATVSACEIYCENVRDLLSFMSSETGPRPVGASGGSKAQPPKRTASLSMRSILSGASKVDRMKRELSQGNANDVVDNIAGGQSLKIREGPSGVYVEGQSSVEIRSMAEMGGIIFAAIENRMVRATNMNADSSRSHLIFVIDFTQTQTSASTGRQTVTKSKVNLIDLAGSERARTTGASGDGLREGANINKSLSTLGRVISTLAEGKPRDHVPYRDSKLTYILKDSLGGDSKTAMLATISPSEVNYEETVSTLRYAASVKRIKTSASQHLEQEAGEMIEKLKAEVDALATELKNQEIQAAALAEEHRRAIDEVEKARPVKVMRDDKELAKLKAELANMSKRAERYRSERDGQATNLGAMEKRAERYRQERKVAEERVKALEKDLAKAEKGSLLKNAAGSEPTSPKTPLPQPDGLLMSAEAAAAASKAALAREAEVARLLLRVRELEGLVSSNAGMGADMQSAINNRRDTGTHLSRMSLELEATAAEKAKLEQKLRRKSEQMRDPMAVMSMGFSSMFGALAAVPAQDDDDSDADNATDDDGGGSAIVSVDGTQSLDPRVGFTRKASTLRRSTERTLAAAAGDASAVPGIVVDSLRHQLEESNAMNEALEHKVHDQHAKLVSLAKAMAELQAVQQAIDSANGGEGGSGGGGLSADTARLEAEKAALVNEKRALELKAIAESEARQAVEAKLAEAEEAELRLRAAKDELLAAKDLVEDELRASHAKAAEDLKHVADRAEKAELNAQKLEKQKAKLEREMEKLQKRHAELRAASKRLLAEKIEKKADEEGEPGSPRAGKSPARQRSPKRLPDPVPAAPNALAAVSAPAAPVAAAVPGPVVAAPVVTAPARGRSPPPKPAAAVPAGEAAARTRTARSASPRAVAPAAPSPVAAAEPVSPPLPLPPINPQELPARTQTTPLVVDLAASGGSTSRPASPRAGRGGGTTGRGTPSGGRSPRGAPGGRGGRGEASGRGGRSSSPRSAQASVDLTEQLAVKNAGKQAAENEKFTAEAKTLADAKAAAAAESLAASNAATAAEALADAKAVAAAKAVADANAAAAAVIATPAPAALGEEDDEAKKKAERAQKLKDARLKAAALKEQKQARIARASREMDLMEAAE